MDDFGFQSRELHEKQTPHNSMQSRTPHQRRQYRKIAAGNIRQFIQALWRIVRTRRSGSEWKKIILRGMGGGIALTILFLLILWISLPNIDNPQTLFAAQSTVILDRNEVELYRVFSEVDRTYVPLTQMSESVKRATIAIEDERFHKRGCFDAIGFTRAVLSQFIPGFVRSGGSTITQQFAKNAVVGRRRTIIRKIRELMVACQLEQRYNKDELLELYLNWIPYGQNAYGVEQAAKQYFGTSAAELNLEQGAILAALPQLPSYYNPYGKHVRTTVSDRILKKIIDGDITSSAEMPDDEVAIGLLGQDVGTGGVTVYVGGRTDQVLKNMEKLGMITEEDRLEAVGNLASITFQASREDIRAPHFVLWIREQVAELLGGINEDLLEQGGLQVITTLDWELQKLAEKAVERQKDNMIDLYNANNVALIAMNPDTREVLAYVGNLDYNDEENEGKIDMVRAPRQPGSSFKPFVYALAFENGYGPATVIYDVETKIGDDLPQNFDGEFEGIMSMRTALGHSRNIPAAKVFFLAGGEDKLLAFAKSIGVKTPLENKVQYLKDNPDFGYGWPLAIGAAEAPLFEMVQGYATFAAAGKVKKPITILKITDRQGNILYQVPEEPAIEVMDPRIAAQIISVLSDIKARPANEYWRSQLSVPGFQTAGKTGTSNKCLERDEDGKCTLRRPESTWTIGFTPQLVAGVWAGNATSQSLFLKAGGLDTASPIWHDFMVDAHRTMQINKTSFDIPDGIIQPQVSLLSGKFPNACTPIELRKADMFLEENAPTEEDTACQILVIDKVTGLLESDECPKDALEEGSFFLPVSVLPKRWPLWEQAVQEWANIQNELWYATEGQSGSLLPLPLAPTEKCDPALTPGRLDPPEVTLISPGDNGSAPYPAFTPKIRINKTSLTEARYELDGKVLGVIRQAPFTKMFKVPKSVSKTGQHILKVTITDPFFNKATDQVRFQFQEDTRAPTVRFTVPSRDTTVPKGTEITMSVSATDDGGIERVQFYLDDTLLTTRRNAPYQVAYPLNNIGTHILKALAKDNAGNEKTVTLTVTVVDTPPIAAPSLISPIEGLKINAGATVEINVHTPPVDEPLIITLRNTSSNETIELKRIDDGEGLFIFPWHTLEAGNYVISLVKGEDGEQEVISQRTVTVR